jgi:hypothetical protein
LVVCSGGSSVIIGGLVPVIAPDSTAVGLPLRRCFSLRVGSPLLSAASGASPAARLLAGAGGDRRYGNLG